jgi:hypothetical protein
MELFVGEMVAPGELYVLDDDAFYIDTPADESTYRVTLEQLRNGAAPAMALGPGHQRFSYDAIVRLCFDQVRLDIDIDLQEPPGKEQEAMLLFRERQAFLAACDALRARVANRFAEADYRPSVAQAAWGGTFAGSLILFLTLMFFQAARTAPAAEISGEEQTLRTAFSLAGGATGVLIIGLLLAAGPFFYAWRRARKRSEFRILQPQPFTRPGVVATVVKYAGLALVLFFCVRLALR